MSRLARVFYLAYGSNMLPGRIEQRLGRCEAVGVASLTGYALRFHKRGRDGSGKCDAFRTGDATDMLYGVVYAMSEAQRTLLDDFEGPGYASRDVRVEVPSGELTAYAYVARPGHLDADLLPFEWYKSIVLAGAHEHGLPGHYIESITAVSALTDPDSERHSLHQAILEAGVEGKARR